MSDEEGPAPPEDAGIPAWVMTFADLMSLLMCFFVLLLSFSEMDLKKFKQLAGSMDQAFGVQREVKAMEIPKGTSIIAQEFSPGRPEPTIVKSVRQVTMKDKSSYLDMGKSDDEKKESKQTQKKYLKLVAKDNAKSMKDAVKIATELAAEIKQGKIEVEVKGVKIIIRILEHAAFMSGSAELKQSFLPIMNKVRGSVKTVPGAITVSGHTDNIPIRTHRFRSNWDLSTGRAVSVAHELLNQEGIPQSRITVQGHGQTQPLLPNDTPPNRARNRRVEIVIQQGRDQAQGQARDQAKTPSQKKLQN